MPLACLRRQGGPGSAAAGGQGAQAHLQDQGRGEQDAGPHQYHRPRPPLHLCRRPHAPVLGLHLQGVKRPLPQGLEDHGGEQARPRVKEQLQLLHEPALCFGTGAAPPKDCVPSQQTSLGFVVVMPRALGVGRLSGYPCAPSSTGELMPDRGKSTPLMVLCNLAG